MRFWLRSAICCALLGLPRFALASTILWAGDYTAFPMQETVVVQLRGSTNLNTLNSLLLRLQIGAIEDLAPPVFIPGFDLNGTVWPNSAFMIGSAFDFPNTATTSIGNEEEVLPAFTDGLLTSIIVDVRNAAPGTYPILWTIGESNLTEFYEGNNQNPLNEDQLQLIPGSITVVPEPGSLLLALLGSTLVVAGLRYVR